MQENRNFKDIKIRISTDLIERLREGKAFQIATIKKIIKAIDDNMKSIELNLKGKKHEIE